MGRQLVRMSIEFLDSHYLALAAILSLVIQLIGWVIAVCARTETHYDFFGGINFIAVAVVTMCLKGTYSTREVCVTGLVCLSRAELAGFLAYRVLQREGDARFEEAKNNALTMLVFWTLQVVWVFAVVSPCIYINGSDEHPDITVVDAVAIVLIVVGFCCEVGADVQKYRFRSDAANKGRVCAVGLWGWSRHPNYFGEILLWWGVFLAGTPVFMADPPGWATMLSPLITMLLLLGLSGIPLAEGKALKRFYKTEESGKAY